MNIKKNPTDPLCTMTPSEEAMWRSVNDAVMGGLSSSQFKITEAQDSHTLTYIGFFKGVVTDENNGGFASVASPIEQTEQEKSTSYTGIQLHCRGDGKEYQIRLRTTYNNVVTRYKFEFGPVNQEWETIIAPFNQFIATHRGKEIIDAPTITSQSIDEVGLLISKRQLGEFCLQIRDIQLIV